MASPYPTPPDLTPGGLECAKPQPALYLHDFLEGKEWVSADVCDRRV